MGESLVIPTLIPVLEVPPILPKMLDLVSVGTQVYAPIQQHGIYSSGTGPCYFSTVPYTPTICGMLNRCFIALVMNWMGTRHRPICKFKVLESVLGRKKWYLNIATIKQCVVDDNRRHIWDASQHPDQKTCMLEMFSYHNEFHYLFQTQSNIGALSTTKRRNDVGSARGSCDREDRPQVSIVVPCFHDITHHERRQSMIGWGALCSLSCLSAKIRQEFMTNLTQ